MIMHIAQNEHNAQYTQFADYVQSDSVQICQTW
jgi:hypothetical protein